MSAPIRARSVSAILDDVFRQYRTHFLPMFLVGLVFLGSTTVMEALIASLTPSFNYQQLLSNPSSYQQLFAQAQNQGQPFALFESQLLRFLEGLISINIVMPLISGVYYLVGTDTLIDESAHPSPWVYLRKAVSRWGAYLATWWLLFGLVVAGITVIALATMVPAGLTSAFSSGSQIATIWIIVLIVVFLAMLCFSIFLSIRLTFTFVAVVVERRRNWGAIKRSWVLTVGAFWRIFWITLIAGLIISVATSGFQFIATFLLPTQSLRVLVAGLFTIVLSPLMSLLTANLYVDQRIRKEGYDIELAAQEDLT